jgi:Icc-related predicted phosphoesterase
MRIAAAGDLHCTRDSAGSLRPLFAVASEAAEAIALCGDLTDHGLAEEADVLAAELSGASVPVVAVLGNHDHEAGDPEGVADRLAHAGVSMLERDSVEIGEVGFAGTKGFAGGFGTHALGAWGEAPIKAFVQAAITEELALEAGLARLRTPYRVAVLHYSPIGATVEGEPEAIHAWLGSSRLEEPIDRYAVTSVVHGHAHYGTLDGRTRGGVPVYNVARPLLHHHGETRGFRVIDVPPVPDR